MKTIKPVLSILVVCAAMGIVLMNCSPSAHEPVAIHAQTLEQLSKNRLPSATGQRPVIGLALGGGGLRGLAHIGVLQALEDAGIRPDLIVGTSAGALVGASYASGKSARDLLELAGDVEIASFMDVTLSAGGIMRGDHIAEWMDEVAGGRSVETFPIRFAAMATDLGSGAPVVLDRGRPGELVRASAAVPGVTIAVPYRDGHLVDGGVSSLVPVRAARALGADVVIAVDIYCQEPAAAGASAASVLRQTMRVQTCLISAPELAEADVRITPSIAVPGISDKDQQARAIQVGYRAAHDVLSRIDIVALLAPVAPAQALAGANP